MDVGDKVNDERALFEAWAKPQPYWWNGQTYSDLHTQVAWDAWQAARRTPSASTGENGLPPIEFDQSMQRTYIPLPGGWEIQTKGNGSTFRIAHVGSRQRWQVLDDQLHEPLEAMARDMREAVVAARVYQRKVDEKIIARRDAEIADLRAQLARQSQGGPLVELVAAADAVVERWHSRDWKQPHTGEFISRLAAAVGAIKFAAPPLSSEPQSEKGESNA